MLFITGSGGMVGNYVKKKIKELELEAFCPSRVEFDLQNVEKFESLVLEKKITHVIHLAAETDVDLCERNPEHAYIVNSYSTKKISEICSKYGLELVYISTSNVFGKVAQYSFNELDSPNPMNYYGKSKLRAEEYIKQNTNKHYILRAGWMIGGGPDLDKKFVGKILKQISEGKTELKAVADKFGSLTYAKRLADLIFLVINSKKYGTYHVSSETPCSRFDVAKKLSQQNKNKNIKVDPCLSVDFPLSAPRPSSEAIKSVTIKNNFAEFKTVSWEEALDEYLMEW